MRWLIITVASACAVLSHVIPKEPGGKNVPDAFVSGCNETKSCFLVPDSCLTSGSCRAGVAVSATGDHFQFEMMAVDSVYVAVGLSDDAFMGKDSVVECLHDVNATEKGVQIFVSFNVGTKNTRIKTSVSENGVNLATGSFVDGVIRCTFTRDSLTRAEGVVFDLAKRQYHLLVAAGSRLHTYGIAFHDRESSGSRNGRLMADIGMFVNPNSATPSDPATSTPSIESSEEYETYEETGEDNQSWSEDSNSASPSDPATSTPGVESSEEYETYEDKEEDYTSWGKDRNMENSNTSSIESDSYELIICGTYESDILYDSGEGVDGVELTTLSNTDHEAHKGFTARGCNDTKSCFLLPPSCLQTDSCTLAASVRRTTAGFEFEIHAVDSVYVAVALSTDAIMGSDSVVECTTNGSNIHGYTSWNKGHKNHRILGPLSKSGIALLEGSTSGGDVYCKFTRDPVTTVEGVVFDLTNSKFHLLMASGSSLKAHGIGFHNRGYAGSYAGRLLSEVGMFTQRRHRSMIDEPEEGDADADSYELADAFLPIVTIV